MRSSKRCSTGFLKGPRLCNNRDLMMAQLCPNPDCSYTATPIVAFGCVLRGVGVAICTRTWKGTQSEHLILDCWAFMNDADRCGKGQLSKASSLSFVNHRLAPQPAHTRLSRASSNLRSGTPTSHSTMPRLSYKVFASPRTGLHGLQGNPRAYSGDSWMQDARSNQCRRPHHRPV